MMATDPAADDQQQRKPGSHKRNTGPMMLSQRCGAKTRAGTACLAPAVTGKKRCRMHGGAKGSGAPRGNQNALKHGYYTRKEKAWRRKVHDFLRGRTDYYEV